MNNARSRELFDRAQKLIPGGVNSPARAWNSVGGTPFFVQRAEGSRVWDVDGNEFIDYISSWGPMILGHAHPRVLAATHDASSRGTSYGMPVEDEVRMAELVTGAAPSVDVVRFVNSGTEATMSALRVARAHTGRQKILKFEGGYHGHVDALLVAAGSGAATHGVPDSGGVPATYAQDTLVAPYNDLEAVEELVGSNPGQIAAVIVEPVGGNMGLVPPDPGFLEGLRDITRRDGSLLVFDEVITGFRVAYGGAQERFGVTPDISCFGKIIGGGFPVGAYGARREIMEHIAPLGPVYQAGTLAGNPVAMAAGAATLEELRKPGVYDELEAKGNALQDGLEAAFKDAGIPAHINRVGSLLTVFFTGERVRNMSTASASDREQFGRFFHAMLEEGISLPPSQFEAWFVSLAHTDQDIQDTVEAARRSLRAL